MDADRGCRQHGDGEVGSDFDGCADHAHAAGDRADGRAEYDGDLHQALGVGQRGIGIGGRTLELEDDPGVTHRASRLIRHPRDEGIRKRLAGPAALAVAFDHDDLGGLVFGGEHEVAPATGGYQGEEKEWSAEAKSPGAKTEIRICEHAT